MPTLTANGAELYYEVRGSGPPVLLIMGATGDAGHFERVADQLADEFTVVTYDRRGLGRSPRPPAWKSTSPEEQADDAVALLDALGLSPAAVFGNSYGAIFALCLLIRHPDAARGAILHEPPLLSGVAKPEEVPVARVVQEGMKAGGPQAALERFWRVLAGDANWENLDSALRERMLAGAETLFAIEMGAFEFYRPDDSTLAAIQAPVQVLVSEQSLPFLHEATGWLAERLGVPVSTTPGTHTPYQDRPRELAETIRPFLQRVSAGAAPV